MKHADFEARMRAGEAFHDAIIPREKWAIVRCDGRAFSRLTSKKFEKPFDARFHELMCGAALALFREFDGVFATTHSDEISVLLPLDFGFFGRAHEKLVSIAAGIVSAQFSANFGQSAHFDARIWLGESAEMARDYFRWRQSDGIRCALNGAVYHFLRAQNQSARAATRFLEGRSHHEKRNFLHENGASFEELPIWAQRGVGIVNEDFEQLGFNPVSGENVLATRRRAVIREMPEGDELGQWLGEMVFAGLQGQ